jgi:ABC-type uncharacterized transport system permease subunit
MDNMIQAYTCKPTLVQRILGKNYKWWYIVIYNYKTAVNDKIGLLFAVLRFTIPILVSTLVYSSFETSRNLTGELALGNFFFQITAMAFGISWDLRFNIIKGGLTNKLLQPTDYITSQLFVALGFNLFVLIIRFCIYFPLLFLFGSKLLITPNLFLAFLVIVISFLAYFFAEIILGCTAFWFQVASNRILEVYYDLIQVLSGATIILSLNPITQKFTFLPFSIASWHPLQIYLGKYDTNQTFLVFIGGITWCLILYFLAKLIFKLGLRRNEAVGL